MAFRVSDALLRKVGLTREMVEIMDNAQGGRCALCFKEKLLILDHCHKYNEARGLICRGCNFALGVFEDDPDRMIRAADYVKRAWGAVPYRLRGYEELRLAR